MKKNNGSKKKKFSKNTKHKKETLFRFEARPYVSFIYSKNIFKPKSDFKLEKKFNLQFKSKTFQLIKYTLQNTLPIHSKIFGTPKPQSLGKLWKTIPTEFTNNLESELNWTSASIIRYSDDLKSFILQKNRFDNSLLLGNYQEAEQCLKCIESQFGQSLWKIEVNLLLSQKMNGLQENRQLLRKYQEKCNSAVRFLAYFYSMKSEDNLPLDEYNKLLSFLQDSESKSPIYSALRFRANYHNFKSIEAIPFILNLEESSSIIDRYLNFVKVIRYILINRDNLWIKIQDLLVEIYKKILDIQIEVIVNILENTTITVTDFKSKIFEILDYYTQGKYIDAYHLAVDELIINPGCFELYELTIKSLIRSGEKWQNPFSKNTIAESIFQNIYLVLTRTDEKMHALQKLFQLSYQLDSMSISGQLFSFYKLHSEDQDPLRIDKHSIFSSTIVTPKSSIAYNSSRHANIYLLRLKELYPMNAAVDLFYSLLKSTIENKYCIPNILLPDSRLCKYKAYVLENLKRYQEALNEYKSLYLKSLNNPLLLADAIAGQYRCCLRLGYNLECAIILCSAMVSNSYLISNTTLYELIQLRESENCDESIKGNISWPILYSVAQKNGCMPIDNEKIQEILDDFLTSLEIIRPSQLKKRIGNINIDNLIYLLRYVCVPEVLDSFIWYKTQDEIEKERLFLCEWLIEIDSNNRSIYSIEIAQLSRQLTIRELTHQVERSKIFVDTQGILISISQGFRARVERCLTFAELSEDLRKGIDNIKKDLEEIGIFPEQLKKVNFFAYDEGLQLFRELFEELKQLFISSNEYGLDSNLSQRIRHGTFSGEIRAQFELPHFVTQKNVEGEYRDNEFWLTHFEVSVDNEIRSQVSSAFRILSTDVDNIVYTVRNTWIQIKSEANQGKGMFDFDFQDKEFLEYYKLIERIKDTDEFIKFVFELLWARTEKDLEKVREVIQNDLKKMLFASLDKCQATLQTLLNIEKIVDFRSAVTNCKTQLTNALNSVAEWFYRDNSQNISNNFPIIDLVDAILNTIKRFSGPVVLKVNKNIEGNDILNGQLLRAFWDLMFILFDNIAKHSGKSETNVNLEVRQEANRIFISVENELGTELNIEMLRYKLPTYEMTQSIYRDKHLVRREGGSGFVKIHKIIRSDLGCENYKMNLIVTEEKYFKASIVINFGND